MTASDPHLLPPDLSDLTREELQRLVKRLAEENESVAQRIRYLLRPQTAVRDVALRIASLRRSDYRHDRSVAEMLGDELQEIVTDIERDVLPHEPVRALALAESLLALDQRLMEYESDYGSISGAFEDASTLWLKAGRAARDSGYLPLMDWPARLREVLGPDSYCVRRQLLKQARLLLDEPECQRLNEHFTREAREKAERRENSYPRLTSSDLSRAWRDRGSIETPLGERTPAGELERARFHLDCGDVDQALAVLAPLHSRRQEFCDPENTLDLLDRAYGQLGDTVRRIEVRRERLRLKPDLMSYHRLEQLLDEPALQALREELALKPPATRDMVMQARVLLAARLPLLAQNLVLANAKGFEIEGMTSRLAALGMEATELGFPLIATVVWRGLVSSILNTGKSRDYHIGTRLLAELQQLATEISDYHGLPTHIEYEADLYKRHWLKGKFWRHIQLNVGTSLVPA